MNKLSWAIYVMDVCQGMAPLLGIVGGLSAGGWTFWKIIATVEEEPPPRVRWLVLAVFAMFIANFIPSQKAFMAIIASEAGEQIASSRQVTELADPAFDLVKKWMAAKSKELDSK